MSVNDITHATREVSHCHHLDSAHGSLGAGRAGRLERAALELYLENGYDQTTVAEIAGRAGLTERTFFRHFTDKREVLFRGDELAQAMADAIDSAPRGQPRWMRWPRRSTRHPVSSATAARTRGTRQTVINANPCPAGA